LSVIYLSYFRNAKQINLTELRQRVIINENPYAIANELEKRPETVDNPQCAVQENDNTEEQEAIYAFID